MPARDNSFLWIPVDPKAPKRPGKVVKAYVARRHVHRFRLHEATSDPDRNEDYDGATSQTAAPKDFPVPPNSMVAEVDGPAWLINVRVSPENILGPGGLDPFNMFPGHNAPQLVQKMLSHGRSAPYVIERPRQAGNLHVDPAL